MVSKDYKVSKETLKLILMYVQELHRTADFIQEEYRNVLQSEDFRGEVLCDGVHYRLDNYYQNIYKLLDMICNNEKL